MSDLVCFVRAFLIAFFIIKIMKKIIILIVLLFKFSSLSAQKNDYIWVIGYEFGGLANGSILDFNYSPVKIRANEADINFYYFTDSNICDSLGALQFYTNGVNFLNAEGNIMDGGYHIFSCDSTSYNHFTTNGCISAQTVLTLPFPNHPGQYINIMGQTKFWDVPGQPYQNSGLTSLFYNYIDMNINNGKGKVRENHNIISKDTFGVSITAVRHADGKNWWIMAQKAYSNIFIRMLLDQEGIHIEGEQKGGLINRYIDAAFSPDGTIYANLIDIFGPDNRINVFKFDRCAGLLSDTISFKVKNDSLDKGLDIVWGIAISPNSRFLYVSSDFFILQYDLQSKDIEHSRIVVAAYDGYRDERTAQTVFAYPRLAPDGKIYISTYVGSQYLHVIEYPDSLGLACKVVQRAVTLPSLNRTVPNYPYFRLGASKTPCTTAVSETDVLKAEIYPNPTTGTFNLSFEAPLNGVAELKIYDLIGRFVKTFTLEAGATNLSGDISGLASGAYICILTEDKKIIWSGKLAMIK